jgi:hypothetical protein
MYQQIIARRLPVVNQKARHYSASMKSINQPIASKRRSPRLGGREVDYRPRYMQNRPVTLESHPIHAVKF